MSTFPPVPVRGGPHHGTTYALQGGVLPAEIEMPCARWNGPDEDIALGPPVYSVETALGVPVYLAFLGYRT